MDRIGIFEVDCRQRAESEEGLCFVHRAEKFSEQIHQIYAFAEKHDIPIVFTTCCADRLLSKDDARGTLFVPMDPTDKDWLQEVSSQNLIYIEKTTWGSPAVNTQHCAWDMFRHNGNAEILFKELGISRWVVYGVGIDLCVNSATRGLLNAGCEVVILKDILVNNAGGTSDTMERVIEQLCEMGATTQTFREFLMGNERKNV